MIEQLSADIAKQLGHPEGFYPQKLWFMQQFCSECQAEPLLLVLAEKIYRGQDLVILSKRKDKAEQEYYVRATDKWLEPQCAVESDQSRCLPKSQTITQTEQFQNRFADELKSDRLEPEFAGTMNFYLYLLDEQVEMPYEYPLLALFCVPIS